MADETNQQQSTTATDGNTATVTDAFMQMISTVNVEGISAVYASGLLLTLAIYALGMKVGVAIQAIRKL